MFKFLKDKLKGALSAFSKKVEEQVSPESSEQAAEVAPPEKPVQEHVVTTVPVPTEKKQRVKLQKQRAELAQAHVSEERVVSSPTHADTPPASKATFGTEELPLKKQGFFKRVAEKITMTTIDETTFHDLFWDVEIVLLENNVAVGVVDKLRSDLQKNVVNKPLPRSRIKTVVQETLRQSVKELFAVSSLDLLKMAKQKKPFIMCFVGINGSGKTTTIAKVAKLFIDAGHSVVLAAADTFRAAAIDQLQIHADRLGAKLIKNEYGADAAAVAFDAIAHAKAKNKDIVLIDTAGRLHSNTNLVDEMKKIVRVAQPDLKLFVGESITGNDCVEQAKKFDEAIGLDGIILSKADVDDKGGAAISMSYVTKKPILYLGTGQEYADLIPFNAADIVEKLFA